MDVCGLAHAGTSVDREQMRDRVQSSASSSKIRVAQRSLRSGLGEGQAWRDWTGFPVRASTRATTRACRYPKTSFYASCETKNPTLPKLPKHSSRPRETCFPCLVPLRRLGLCSAKGCLPCLTMSTNASLAHSGFLVSISSPDPILYLPLYLASPN